MATPLSMLHTAPDHARLTPVSEGLASHFIIAATNITQTRLAPIWIRHDPHVQESRQRRWSSRLASHEKQLLSWCLCLPFYGGSAVKGYSGCARAINMVLLGLFAGHNIESCLRRASIITSAYLAREEGFLGEVVAVPGPSTYSCSAVLCSDGLSCAAASRRSARGGGEGDGDL